MKNAPCFILGNGPSLNDSDISSLSPYFTLGINRAFLKIDPTITLWQDIEFWHSERKQIVRLSSIKVCRNTADPQNRFYHFRQQPGDFAVPKHPGCLYGMGTTGPIAVQFAHALGCNPIILLGMDCKVRDGKTDFYGNNKYHKPHTMENCSRGLNWVKKNITDIDIINCSNNDLWKNHALEKVLKEKIDQSWKQDRSYYVSLLTK